MMDPNSVIYYFQIWIRLVILKNGATLVSNLVHEFRVRVSIGQYRVCLGLV